MSDNIGICLGRRGFSVHSAAETTSKSGSIHSASYHSTWRLVILIITVSLINDVAYSLNIHCIFSDVNDTDDTEVRNDEEESAT